MYNPIPLNKSQRCGVGYWEGLSPKLRRDVTLLGDLEYDHWILIETNPNIISYCERPIQLSSLINGKIVHSIPSVWVKYSDDSESLIKVRYSKSNPIKSKSIDQEIANEQQWCKDKNMGYCVVTENDIRSNALLLSNKRLIVSMVSNRLIPIDTDIFQITHFINNQKVTLNKMFESFSIPDSRIIEGICWLLFKGVLRSNLDQVPIGSKLEVWLNE